MKKRTKRIGALVLAVSVFTATAFATSTSNDVYDEFKDIMKSQKSMDIVSGTMDMDIQITHNGESIIDLKGFAKGDKENKNMSGEFSFTGQDVTKSIEIYKNDDKNIIVDKINDLYYQVEKAENYEDFRGKRGRKGNKEGREGEETREMTPEKEAIADFLVADLKDNFSMEISETGSKTISFEAYEEDIPSPINLMLSMASSKKHEDREMKEIPEQFKDIPLLQGMQEMHEMIPELKEDIKILKISFDITVDDNKQIVSNSFIVKLEGKDVEGGKHELEIKGNINISDINNTIIDSIDLEGKEVREIEFNHMDKKE